MDPNPSFFRPNSLVPAEFLRRGLAEVDPGPGPETHLGEETEMIGGTIRPLTDVRGLRKGNRFFISALAQLRIF